MNDAKLSVSNVLWPILGVVAVVLLCLLAVNACVRLTMASPRAILIGEVAAGEHSLPIFWPYGHHHELILGVPGGEWSHPPIFSAAMRFREGDRVSMAFKVDSTNAVSCNWLQPGDIQGFILTWPNTNEWDHSLVPGRRYLIDCALEGNVPSNSTLWVNCLQTGMDQWKTERNRTKP